MDRNGKQGKKHFKVATSSSSPQDFENWEAIFDEDPTEEERAQGSPFTNDDVEDEYTYTVVPAGEVVPPPAPPPTPNTEDKAVSAKPETEDKATSDDDIIDLVIKELSLPINVNEEQKHKKKTKKPVTRKLSTEEEQEASTKIKVGDGKRTGAKIPQQLLAAAAAHVAKTAKPKPVKPKKRDLEPKKEEEEPKKEEEAKKKKEELEPKKKKIMKKEDAAVQEQKMAQTDEMCFPVFNIQPRRMFVIYMCESCSVQESICAPSGKQVITITVCPTCVTKNDQISACM